MKRPSSLSSRQQVRMSVPSNSDWPSIEQNHDQILKFSYSLYPFPNRPVTADFFNTILHCNLNEDKIQKIVNFKCDHVIGLKKIVKMKKKDHKINESDNGEPNLSPVSTYSFYYEKVEYSLGYILESKNKKQSFFLGNKFNLDRAQIKKTLAAVIASLYKEGITSFLQFGHIGVNQKGIIKVYIAPNLLFDRYEFNPKTKVLMLTCLNNVLKQIDSKFPKSLHSKCSIQSFNFKPEKMSIQKGIIQSEQSFFVEHEPHSSLVVNNKRLFKDRKKNVYEHQEGSFNDEEQNFVGVSGSTNLEHLKLKKQMKKKSYNNKFVSKVSQNVQNQKKSKILKKMEQKQKIDQLTLQLELMRQKIRQKIQQKRQKNICASKIFKTLATQDHTQARQKNSAEKCYKNVFAEESPRAGLQSPKRGQLHKKRKSSQSSINFYQGVISQQKNINCINIYNPKNFPQKSYRQLMADDGMSVDTYELEIGDDYEMPTLSVPTAMRNSMSPMKIGEIIKNNAAQIKGQTTGEKSRFSESAGGKSYGNIVNLLKPQFVPKKSNIFEEPQNENEEDSKHSMSLKRSIGKELSDRLSGELRMQNNMRPKNPHNSLENNKEIEIKGLKTVEQFKKDLKHIMHMGAKPAQNDDKSNSKFENRLTLPISRSNTRNPEMDLMFLRQTQYRPKTNHKISDILIKKCALEEKVRKAMERTKNAINVLQSAKIRQSGSLNTLKGTFGLD